MKSRSFQSLLVWEKAHNFVLSLYKRTKSFPEDERFGLTSQIRRASISITANIAEGYRKISKKDKLRLFNVSQGSLSEVFNYLILVRDLNYISKEEYNIFENEIESIDKLLNAYCSKIVKELTSSNP